MSTVRAKFVCISVHGDILKSVNLIAVTSDSEENKAFFEASPGGSISLAVLNVAASAQFEVGKEYYVDFTPTPTSIAEAVAAAA